MTDPTLFAFSDSDGAVLVHYSDTLVGHVAPLVHGYAVLGHHPDGGQWKAYSLTRWSGLALLCDWWERHQECAP